jgi:hypothetical protein
VRSANDGPRRSNARELEKEIVETDASITEVQTEVHRMLPGDPARAHARASLAFDYPRFHANAIKQMKPSPRPAEPAPGRGTFKPPWVQKGQTYCCTNEFPQQFCP